MLKWGVQQFPAAQCQLPVLDYAAWHEPEPGARSQRLRLHCRHVRGKRPVPGRQHGTVLGLAQNCPADCWGLWPAADSAAVGPPGLAWILGCDHLQAAQIGRRLSSHRHPHLHMLKGEGFHPWGTASLGAAAHHSTVAVLPGCTPAGCLDHSAVGPRG